MAPGAKHSAAHSGYRSPSPDPRTLHTRAFSLRAKRECLLLPRRKSTALSRSVTGIRTSCFLFHNPNPQPGGQACRALQSSRPTTPGSTSPRSWFRCKSGQTERKIAEPNCVKGAPWQIGPSERPKGLPPAHRSDESPAGYSLASCSPAELASASPAERHPEREKEE